MACLGAIAEPAIAFPFDQPFGTLNPYTRYTPAAPRTVSTPAVTRHFHKRADPNKPAADLDKPKLPDPPQAKMTGPVIIAVSIGNQHLTVYDDGTPIATTPISTGMKGHLTPTGVFSIIQKEKWHRSNLYSNAPMPYMERITWSGVALHAGVLPGYPASHGCIRMPYPFAMRLWGMTKLGARVVITHNDTTPFAIEHPRLASLVRRTEDAAVPGQAPVGSLPRAGAAIGAAKEALALASGIRGLGTLPGTSDSPIDRAAYATATPTTVAARPALALGTNAVPADRARLALQTAQGEGNPGTAATSPLRPSLDATEPPAALPSAPGKPAEAVPGETRPAEVKPPEPPLRSGPISIFISRKEQKLFVRKGFEPVFDVPVSIVRPTEPIGTHIFTAARASGGTQGLRWLAVSIAPDRPIEHAVPEPAHKHAGAHEEKPSPSQGGSLRQAAAEALDRVQFPPEALERILPLVTPGASLLIADQGLGPETGKETDFIVLTR